MGEFGWLGGRGGGGCVGGGLYMKKINIRYFKKYYITLDKANG